MSVQDLLPEQSPTGPDREHQTIDIAEDGALLEALSTETARRIVAGLEESPKPASEIAAETDTSLQNVGYHLDRLEDVGLVEVAGKRYSSKAKQMDVYVPTSTSLVVQLDNRPSS